MPSVARLALLLAAGCPAFAFPVAARAQSVDTGTPAEVVLHFLGGAAPAGVNPLAGVVTGPDGAYYGTTLAGGEHGGGTVFRLGADGDYRVLHAFAPGSGDGHAPRGALVVGADGRLWGTTEDGGAHGLGSVYAITPDGAYQRVHDFDGGSGAAPRAGLTRVGNALYGVASGGGVANGGTLFRIDAAGPLVRLHAFVAAEGITPGAALSLGDDGQLYGTTQGGALGDGSVFRASPGGALTVLHAFAPSASGYAGPGDAGVVAAAGVVHGTTLGDAGGLPAPASAGGVWRLGPGPLGYQELHRFAGSDGALPGSLLRSADGRLYGVTRSGGDGAGTLFRIGADGDGFETLHRFATGSRAADGARPVALAEDADGRLVGTAFASTVPPRFGRADPRNGGGAVFALYPRAPRVQLTVSPAVAAAGSPVTLAWQADTGADGCTAGGSWRGAREARGSVTVAAPRPGERTYRLDCSNPAGTGSSSVVLVVAEPPSISLRAQPAFTSDRQPTTTLSWTAVGASQCVAEGAWSGARPLSSSAVVTPAERGGNRYGLRCSGAGGESLATVSVFRSGTP